MPKLVVLDGSEGEGGGQILRSALSLSLITQTPFTLRNIRAHRKPPGLRPQHLACVRGAEAISGSSSQGAEVGASELTFTPGPVRPGEYLLEIGTAGSTALLLQCLYYPLALAGGGQLTLRGGTHQPHSPSYPYLAAVWAPMLARLGLTLELHLKEAGFYPQGGGEIRAVVSPPSPVDRGVNLPSRGTLQDMDVGSFIAGLGLGIAERQGAAALAVLREKGIYATTENLPLAARHSRGTAVFIKAQFEHSVAGFTALGDRGKPAEQVGREAAAQATAFMASGGAVDEHLGDQLLVPAALLAAGVIPGQRPVSSRFTPSEVTSHLTTNARILERFLPVKIEVGPEGEVRVTVAPVDAVQDPPAAS